MLQNITQKRIEELAEETADVTLNVWDKVAFVFVEDPEDVIPDDAHEQIDESLSFIVPDHQYTDAWKNGRWDGRERLYNTSGRGNRYFPIGLLPRVTRILDLYSVDYRVDGLTRPGRGDVTYEWDDAYVLRDYQRDAVDTALDAGMGTIVSPTGTGKTLVGLRLIHELGHPVMIVSDRTEVADQWSDRIEETLGVDVARCYGGDRENGDVMVALYQSLYEDGDVREDVRLDHPVLIQDEAHLAAAETYYRVALAHSAAYRFGMTATYNRSSGDELKIDAGTGPVIVDLDVEDMIRDGWLAEPEFRILDPPRLSRYSSSWQSELSNVCSDDARNEMLISEVERLLDDGVTRILMDVSRIAHGERLTAMCEDAGIDARFVYSDTPTRSEDLDDFQAGEYPVLVSTLVDTGWNCPELEAVILSTPVKSATANIQVVGRALRPSTDKAYIVDVADKGEYTSQWFEQRLNDFREYYGPEYGP